MYFASVYPNSIIYGYEADKSIYKFLDENIKTNAPNSENIFLFNQAVWNCDTELSFFSEGGDGGKVSNNSEQNLQEIIDILSDAGFRIYIHSEIVSV